VAPAFSDARRGHTCVMQIRRRFQRRIHVVHNGVSLAGDGNAAVAGNVGERGATTQVSGQQDAAPLGNANRPVRVQDPD
jgi:hypothetical protein